MKINQLAEPGTKIKISETKWVEACQDCGITGPPQGQAATRAAFHASSIHDMVGRLQIRIEEKLPTLQTRPRGQERQDGNCRVYFTSLAIT